MQHLLVNTLFLLPRPDKTNTKRAVMQAFMSSGIRVSLVYRVRKERLQKVMEETEQEDVCTTKISAVFTPCQSNQQQLSEPSAHIQSTSVGAAFAKPQLA